MNPQREDDTSGLGMLCGAGIAWMMIRALSPLLGLPQHFPLHLLDLVALATVADVVPLVDQNRIIVRHGLRLMADTRWAGLRALLHATKLLGKELKAGQMGFIIGPRLNAAGRVGEPMEGLRLLLTDDPQEAAAIAARLEVLNTERQALDQQMLEEALAQVDELGGVQTSGLVLAGDAWHPGVVGIVASRVVERFGRPTFLVAFDGETGRASGRSISRFDLHAALVQCGDLLERFGGHHMAAGLTIRRDRLDAFRERFNALVAGKLTPEELVPSSAWISSCRCARRVTHWSGSGATWNLPAPETRAPCSVCAAYGSGRGAGWAMATSRGSSRTVRRAWPVSGSAGPTGCPGWATRRWTWRSASRATIGMVRRHCRPSWYP